MTDLRSDQPYTPTSRQAASVSSASVPIGAKKQPVTRPQHQPLPPYRQRGILGINGPALEDDETAWNYTSPKRRAMPRFQGFDDFLTRPPSSSRTTINIQGGSDVSISFTGRPERRTSPAPVDLTRAPKASGRPLINQVIVNLLDADKNRTPSSPQILSAVPAPEPPRKESGLNINCGICLDKISQPAATPCGHVFCYQCLSLSQRSQKQCPLCRKPLSVRQIHKLFI